MNPDGILAGFQYDQQLMLEQPGQDFSGGGGFGPQVQAAVIVDALHAGDPGAVRKAGGGHGQEGPRRGCCRRARRARRIGCDGR